MWSSRNIMMADWQEIENENMKTLLCTVEWKHGRNNQFFGFTKDKRRLKISESPVGVHIFNTFFLDNLLICYRGANNLDYFGIEFNDVITASDYLN